MNRAELVPVDSIILDKANPRIKLFMEMYQELNEAQMLLALGAGAYEEGGTTAMGSYDRLKHSIRASKGIIQPIILKPAEGTNYLCIEGNTRVAIYRQLREEERERSNESNSWDHIPAIVDNQIDEYEAHKIRLQVHLVGNRQWDPYSKAKYLHELSEEFKMPMRELVSFCGGSTTEVQQSINAYRDMENHYRAVIEEAEGAFDPRRFSAFLELQKSGVKESLYESGYDEKDFSKWVDTRKIFPLHTVRKLPDILEDPQAKADFLKNGARNAIKTLEAPKLDTKLREANIFQLTKALQEKVDQLSYEDAQRIASNQYSEEYLDLSDLVRSLQEILQMENGEDN